MSETDASKMVDLLLMKGTVVPEPSSVPEAARAAAIDAFFGPNPDLPRRSVLAMQVALDAAAPFIVAAAVAERCTCGTPGLNYEGPQEDCDVHGEDRAVLIEQRDSARAAVAEERATTGRRIEAVERLCEGIERDSTLSVYGAEAKGYAKVVAVQLRAALASPGEGE